MDEPRAVKTVITVTVYTSDPLVEATGEAEGFPFLTDVVYEMTYGDAVGTYEVFGPETIEGDALREGLRAVGNDGTFFDRDES